MIIIIIISWKKRLIMAVLVHLLTSNTLRHLVTWAHWYNIEVNPSVYTVCNRSRSKIKVWQILKQTLRVSCDKVCEIHQELIQVSFTKTMRTLSEKINNTERQRENKIFLRGTFFVAFAKHLVPSSSRQVDWMNEYSLWWMIRQHCCGIGVVSLLSGTLYHGVLLAGALKAGGRPGDGPAVRARQRGLDVPLQEVERRVPPGVGEVVVGQTFHILSREKKWHSNIWLYHFPYKECSSEECWWPGSCFLS